MPSMRYELQVRQNAAQGKEVEGKVFRLDGFEMISAFDGATQDIGVAVKLIPAAADPDFKEPVVLVVPGGVIELFIKGLRAAQADTPEAARKGGTA
jgi:hypothetical protein